MRLEGTVARRPKVARLERRLSRSGPTPGRRRLLTGPFADAADQVPQYLRRLAAEAGVDLTDWSWGVAARGEYESQKVLVLLTPPGARTPAGVVKLTRAAGHAHRLRNERAALQRVERLPLFADRAPALWFAGAHADRWVLGQTMLRGRPYAEGTDWSPRSPALQDTLAALGDLAASTTTAVPGAAVCTALTRLLERYEEVYRPDDAERAALRDQLRTLADLAGPLPVVLQHGDPHPGNLLLSDEGRTAFLDWESADPGGMPLNDTLYFFRSYAAAASRRDGVRDGVRGAARHMVDGSALGDRLVEAVHRDAAAIGLPAAAVLPLAHVCWVHRALKEATRTPPGRLGTTPSVRLLRMMLARPDGGTLRQLRAPGG
jgi:aminoglycoside phosphotransferase (APT) family kinase protein